MESSLPADPNGRVRSKPCLGADRRAVERGIEGQSAESALHHQIAVGLEARSQRPIHLFIGEDVDVFVAELIPLSLLRRHRSRLPAANRLKHCGAGAGTGLATTFRGGPPGGIVFRNIDRKRICHDLDRQTGPRFGSDDRRSLPKRVPV